jgi:hypothetical protein
LVRHRNDGRSSPSPSSSSSSSFRSCKSVGEKQCDQVRLGKNSPKCSQTHFCQH